MAQQYHAEQPQGYPPQQQGYPPQPQGYPQESQGYAQQPVYNTPPIQQPSPAQGAPVPQGQPVAQPQSHHGNGNYQATNGGIGGPQQEWSNSFWDCFSPSELCCMAYWCPCVVFGKTYTRTKDPSMASYKPINLACGAWCLSAHVGAFWVLQMLQRSDVRGRYNLAGSSLGDCCRPYCCPCCELMQEEKEVLLRTSQQAPPAQGYQKNEGGMAYGPSSGQ